MERAFQIENEFLGIGIRLPCDVLKKEGVRKSLNSLVLLKRTKFFLYNNDM